MKKLMYILLVCLASSVSAFYCAAGQPVNGLPPRETEPFVLADQALADIFSVYRTYERDIFTQHVSRDFYPIRRNFIHTAENAFYSGIILEINYFIDEAIRKDNKLLVAFSWEKKTKPYDSSQVTLTKGKARFVFVEESGYWLLQQVRGNSPFL